MAAFWFCIRARLQTCRKSSKINVGFIAKSEYLYPESNAAKWLFPGVVAAGLRPWGGSKIHNAHTRRLYDNPENALYYQARRKSPL
jgi:hypothetical protein